MRKSAGERLALIAQSFARLTGKPLVREEPLEKALWHGRRAILAHGTEEEPLFFYANREALRLFEYPAAEFIGLPSHRSAPADQHDERAQLFARLAADDWVENFSGVRVTATGRRFKMFGVTLWNLVDEHGARHGQAARIDGYAFLDG